MAAYFFDTSALAKLYHPESGSQKVDELVRNPDHRILISRLAVVEMHSVIALKVRSQAITGEAAEALKSRFLSDIGDGLFLVLAVAAVHYERAQRLIETYGFRHWLRTLDALQLAVALILPASVVDHVVASDQVLVDVARLEGLSVIDPEQG